MLWIHWREVDPDDGKVYFRMEEVETARMNKLDDVREVRKILHNYLDFSLGERLRSIKEALHAFWPNRPEKKVKKTQSQSSMTVSGLELRLEKPMTPSSSAGESVNRNASPKKKSKRKLTDVSQ
ncbi:hypothetical protein EJ02DRAFT_428390 [Clathrospora elynae]|uniref:Uncharacterized protein n=1 Tax=Clathrospora elynae TaxID=706981 RepID=A0A6A5S4A7_9PLEO|nr:hypothetical protein EJ02DRAFT_428390 [Clathrospora elynae]